jgi:S-phase kinase-associated protein 1
MEVEHESQSQSQLQSQLQSQKEMLILLSSDQKEYKVSRKAAKISSLIEEAMLNDNDDDIPIIPLLEVDSTMLEKIIQFLEHHENDPFLEPEKPLKSNILKEVVTEWDANFITVDNETFYAIVKAADYLNIRPLIVLCICFLVTESKGKERDEIMKRWGMDFVITKEEEMQILKDHPWILDITDDEESEDDDTDDDTDDDAT